jgi:hypothetical protein
MNRDEFRYSSSYSRDDFEGGGRIILMVTRRDKTLEELDGEVWGEPELNSYLVTTCHRLRRIPLRDFEEEDLRIMIGQGFSLDYLVPLAIEYLEGNPFAQGDFYPGDLLENVLRVDREFWVHRPELRQRMKAIAERASAGLGSLRMIDEIRVGIEERLNAFG